MSVFSATHVYIYEMKQRDILPEGAKVLAAQYYLNVYNGMHKPWNTLVIKSSAHSDQLLGVSDLKNRMVTYKFFNKATGSPLM